MWYALTRSVGFFLDIEYHPVIEPSYTARNADQLPHHKRLSYTHWRMRATRLKSPMEVEVVS